MIKIKGNKQEIFDKVITHLSRQGGPSVAAGFCAYRDDKGRKCAIGCLIPDNEYNSSLEQKSVGHLYDKNLLDYKDINYLQDLQNCHDTHSVSFMKNLYELHRRLFEVAILYKLDPSLVSTITKWE